MKYGIGHLSIIPVRSEPSHKSELISQLLFGETFSVINEQKNWLQIECSYDGYQGWIDGNQFHELIEKDFRSISENNCGISMELSGTAASGSDSVPIVAGSSLPFFDGINFKIGKEKFIYNGQSITADGKTNALLERVAMRYLNAPYLWGGRSPFGIDCSGFTQLVFKFMNVQLKRDAYQQAEQGAIVNFIEETLPGDLAFFNNEEGKIIHVGIILKDNKIIHASGKVRIDKLDHFGIHNACLKKYSHQLKIIKRLL
ncbi:MAG: C40 family peptidase [Bacteroidetes bacterium]|nr:C40 family peptidase [Bacteroidota bacterium]